MFNEEGCYNIKVLVHRVPEDNPAKSTAMKLLRTGLASKLSAKRVPSRMVVLDPFAEVVIHRDDSPTGIVVVDRSWKKFLEDMRLPTPPGGLRRRLPALKAGNPVNYSRLYMLSSAEAVAASLYILGCKSRARQILRPFKWGEEFFRLNGELLDRYAEASSRDELILIEKRVLEKLL